MYGEYKTVENNLMQEVKQTTDTDSTFCYTSNSYTVTPGVA